MNLEFPEGVTREEMAISCMLRDIRHAGGIHYLDRSGAKNCNFGDPRRFVQALGHQQTLHVRAIVPYVAQFASKLFMQMLTHYAMWSRNCEIMRTLLVCGYRPCNPAEMPRSRRTMSIYAICVLDESAFPIDGLMVSAICNTLYLNIGGGICAILRRVKSIHQKFPLSSWDADDHSKLSLWDITLACAESKLHLRQIFSAFPDEELVLDHTKCRETRSVLRQTYRLRGVAVNNSFVGAQAMILAECNSRARRAVFQLGVGLAALDLPVLVCVYIAQERARYLGVSIPRFYLWEVFKAIKHFGG